MSNKDSTGYHYYAKLHSGILYSADVYLRSDSPDNDDLCIGRLDHYANRANCIADAVKVARKHRDGPEIIELDLA